MSWFQQGNFAEFNDERPIPIRNRNCFKDLHKTLKRVMSWFRAGNFAAFDEGLGRRQNNSSPFTNVNNDRDIRAVFPLHAPGTAPSARLQEQNPPEYIPVVPVKRPKINVSDSEKQLINQKYQIDTDLIENFVKLKNKFNEISTKLRDYKKEFDENANKIKTSTTKIQELIDESNDKELTDVLTKRIKTNPLHQKNEELEILIGELEKELVPLKDIDIKKNICGICFESEVNCFNKNCGHSFCETCMKKTTKCAACRIKINPGDIKNIF
jgi:hypothetical protein